MNEQIVRNLVLPLHERLRGRNTVKYYKRLHDMESLSYDKIEAVGLSKLQALLEHCKNEVPFYRRILESSGLQDTEEVTLQNYSTLPVLEREDIRNNLHDLLAANYRNKVQRYSTGGSTGTPLVFYTDREKEAWHNAHKLRCRSWHNVLPGDRQVDFWGSPLELNKQSRFRIFKDRWLLNQVVLSAFNLTDERLDNYASFLAMFRPRLVYGYPTVIYRMALFVEAHPGSLDNWRPRLISCTSEVLYDHHRELIKKVFGCPVVNEYGSRDGGLIAHECKMGNFHIAAEHILLEVDKPDEHGVGDLLITNLDAYGMPLIRYRIGDRGSLKDGECKCGLPLPLLSGLSGRTNDFLVGADGRLIHSLAPIYVLREIPKIRQFKLIQNQDLSLEIQLVLEQEFTEGELDNIRQQMCKILDTNVPVEFQFLNTIEPERSGKYRWITSKALQTEC